MNYRFGTIAVDVAAREVTRDGRALDVRPREFDLLLCLLRQRGSAVSKDELIETVWGGVAVSDSALFACVKRLRAALRDPRCAEEDAGHWIHSLYGHGYRFVGDVIESTPAGSAPAPRSTVDAAAALAGDRPIAPRRETEPAAGAARAEHPLLGRERLMSEIEPRLRQAARGAGAIVLLCGEAGIGKTRVAEEAMRMARELGIEVLAARCLEGGQGQGFWPWAQLLREYADTHQQETVREVFGDEAAQLQWLSAPSGGPLASDPALDAALLRTRLFAAVIAVLRRAAQEQNPLLLVFDDLHWADPSSLSLLTALSEELADTAILVLGTWREADTADQHPLRALARRIQRSRPGSCLQLAPLDDVSVERLVLSLVEQEIGREALDFVVRSSEGNPFFATEIWYHLVDEGQVIRRDDRWVLAAPLPSLVLTHGARLVLRERRSRLSEQARAALAAAAVLGRSFLVEQLQRITGLGLDLLADAIDEAAAANLLEHVASDDSYRFSHALVHASVYEDVSPLRRALLHRRVAEELLARGRAEDVAEIARHYLAAAGAGELESVIEHALVAAERDQRRLAYEEAVGWLEKALAVLDRYGERIESVPRRQALRSRVLLELGGLRQLAGRGEEARSAFDEAADIARATTDAQTLARAALGMVTMWSYDDPRVVALLDEARDALAASNSPFRVRVLGALASFHFHDPGRRRHAEELGAEAVRLARELDDPEVLMEALSDWLGSHWYTDNIAEQTEAATELAALASVHGARRQETVAQCWHVVLSLARGEIHAARALTSRVETMASEIRDPTLRWHGLRFRACLALVGGDLADAERLAVEAFELGNRVSERAARLSFNGVLTVVRRQQGRIEELMPMLTASRYASDRLSNLHLTYPSMLAESGRMPQAREAILEMAREGFPDLQPNAPRNTFLFGLSALMETCAVALDGAEGEAVAQTLLEMAMPYRHLWMLAGWGILVLGPLQTMVGMLQGQLGEWQEATDSFSQAIAVTDAEMAPVAGTAARFGMARALLLRGRPVDRREASHLVRDALAQCDRWSLESWRAKLLTLRATS